MGIYGCFKAKPSVIAGYEAIPNLQSGYASLLILKRLLRTRNDASITRLTNYGYLSVFFKSLSALLSALSSLSLPYKNTKKPQISNYKGASKPPLIGGNASSIACAKESVCLYLNTNGNIIAITKA